MNKFLVVLLLIGSCLNFRLRDVPVDDIYAALVALFKGLADNDEYRCAGVLEDNKDEIINIIHMAIHELKDGYPIDDVIQQVIIKIMAIDGFVNECNALDMPAVITKLTTKEGLIEVFQTVINNIDTIYDYGTNIANAYK